LQLNIEDAKNAVEVSRKIHIYMTHKKTLAENLCTLALFFLTPRRRS
jgi:hypothetical protein